ncbi:MAG: DUF1002 domain-containing protein [Lachnospiraceae bacterium]|nr:DUF1002 domain-containing protein [Lachnospiraceae bacterium]
MKIRKMALILASVTAISSVAAPVTAMADTDAPYISLGADLSAAQKATVLDLLGLKESDLDKYTVVTVTNADEHKYLDGKVDAATIGTHALSSCKVTETASGKGITVETHNITYVTPAMYENALTTAGMKDAEVVVAGPSKISGTAALVGAMEAYSKMTGDIIQPTTIDSATDELVTTGKVAQDTGDSEKTTQLVAAVKQIVVNNNYSSTSDISGAVDDVAKQLNISLSDEDRQLIIELMQKISKLDLDTATLTEQAKKVYSSLQSSGVDLSKYGITKEEAMNIFEKLIAWFKGLFH